MLHLQKISEAIRKPIVLHGGSGIPNHQVKKAVSYGVAKVNVNTDLQLVFAKALREYFVKKSDLSIAKKGYDPRKIITVGITAMKRKIIEIFELLGCLGQARKN